MNKSNIYFKKTIPYIVAFLGCVGTTGITSSKTVAYTNSFFSVLFFGISAFFLVKTWNIFEKSGIYSKICSGVLALAVSVALHLGAQFESTDSAELGAKSLFVYTICFAIYLLPILEICFEKVKNLKKKENEIDRTAFSLFKVWGTIFILWVPTFLAMFPGAFVYDATDEYNEVLNGLYNTHHPLIHVLTLGGLTRGAELLGFHANAGIAIYTILQMTVASLIFAYVIKKLYVWGMSRTYCRICTGMIGLFPVFSLYSICSAKDTLFSVCFLLVIVELTEFVRNKRVSVVFVLVSVLMMLLRNNGFYAYLVSIPFVFLLIDKNKKVVLKLIGAMLCSILIYKGVEITLVHCLDASDNEHQEMLTVPIQQLARVYNFAPETFSDDELDTLKEFIPENYLITYNSKISDVLKSGFDNEAYESHGKDFVSLWIKTGMKKPFVYLNAWLANNYGYWYPDMVINVYGGLPMYTFTYVDSSYFGFETEPPGERYSLIKPLEKLYRNISLELFQQRIPVVSMLFSPGFMFYIFAFVLFYLLREKEWKYLACLMPVLLLWATVLLGPTVLVRYVLILWYILPILPIYVIKND